MKSVKVIFIIMEAFCLLGVIALAFSNPEVENGMKALLISLFALNAVVFQKEQQSIDWNEEDDSYVESI